MIICSNFVDIKNREIYPVELQIKNSKIASIKKSEKKCKTYILPGFIDSHIHIESSMLIPSEFARIAIQHATVATVSDPHEIANVLGLSGVEFMLENAKNSGLKFYFGASPCVPATPFETSGATLSCNDIETLLKRDDIYYLSEVMNFPGIINNDKDMLTKIALAKQYKKPIDGHAPALSGNDLQTYIDAGVETDHEAFTLQEAKEKLKRGMKIEIREGSAAKNYEALHPLIDEYYENLMFCSDDKHPDDLIKGHINQLVIRAIKDNHNLFNVLQIACINPIKHYNLDVGMLNEGDNADFIEVENLQDFKLIRSFINGKILYEDNKTLLNSKNIKPINNFHAKRKDPKDFLLHQECKEYRVINAINTQLVTEEDHKKLTVSDGIVQNDIKNDILTIAVINRYENKKPALSFVHGFSLSQGAIASSVAHDSHNIIAVGCDAQSISDVVNALIDSKGGIAAIDNNKNLYHLPLEVAGLMSTKDGFGVAKKYEQINSFVKEELNSKLDAPFMTLSFMALLVIPNIKLSDKGLFDGNSFHFLEECVL